MNFAEPSGSSPPEKPPGRNTTWAERMARSKASAESKRALSVRLRTTTISASIPAARQARALSYSQLVPGNTGITALGRAILWAQTAGLPCSYITGATASVVPVWVG